MTISATTQGLKPGVVTSSNRPANPYDGMMIYETDTDKVAVYDVNAWVYKTGTTAPAAPVTPGFVRVGGGTLSGASTAFSNVFSSTYNNYMISVSGVTSATDADFVVRLGTTTTGYYYAGAGASPTTGLLAIQGNNTSSFFWTTTKTAGSVGGLCYLIQPFLSTRTQYITNRINTQSDGNCYNIGGYLDNSTSYTAFTILAGSGTFTGGTVDIYGMSLT